uniref:Uncharacterized protein n=1 Tax=Panagrolaimus sp. ES5 TaxID=591445 RepID=A0AC34G2B3_9BILA
MPPETENVQFKKRKSNHFKDFDDKKNSSSDNLNTSTLSLHIAAYENSFEATNDEFSVKECLKKKNQKFGLIKKWKNLKQIISASPSNVVQKPFNFPRQQQKDEKSEPEVMQFKASQSLLNPSVSE